MAPVEIESIEGVIFDLDGTLIDYDRVRKQHMRALVHLRLCSTPNDPHSECARKARAADDWYQSLESEPTSGAAQLDSWWVPPHGGVGPGPLYIGKFTAALLSLPWPSADADVGSRQVVVR